MEGGGEGENSEMKKIIPFWGNPFSIPNIRGDVSIQKNRNMNPYRIQPYLLLIFVALIGLSSCQDRVVQTYEANTPIYQSLEEWRQTQFQMEGPRALEHPGKIYIYNNYLIVNELYRGVHFFDNTNPSSPTALGFLPVLANADIAIKDNVMYLDTYLDLLAFDITDIQNPTFLGRAMDVFEFVSVGYLEGYNPNYPMAMVDPSQGIVVGWEISKVTEEVQNNWGGCFGCDLAMEGFVNTTSSSAGANFIGGQGVAGSTARFAIYENALYTLQSWELDVFDISDRVPVYQRSESTRWNSETLFPAQGHLFIGTTNGMLIYNLDNPLAPVFRSSYDHIVACDPVVVSGDRAYVTLASLRDCGQGDNLLEVIDISNLNFPRLINQYDMTGPRGLGLDGNTLFICDGDDGLKVYDRSDDFDIDNNQLAHFPAINTYDVIPYQNVLLMTSGEGIYQYDYSNVNQITQLSLIPVQN